MVSMNIRNMGSINTTGTVIHWGYRAGEHTRMQVLTPGYWNALKPHPAYGGMTLHKYDWIFVSGDTWGAVLYVLASDSEGVVVIDPHGCT